MKPVLFRLLSFSLIISFIFALSCDSKNYEEVCTRWGIGYGVVSHLGNVYMAADIINKKETDGPTTYKVYLKKYGSDGNQIWEKDVNSANSHSFTKLAVDSEGNIIVVGRSYLISQGDSTEESTTTWFLKKYDSSGEAIWSQDLEIDDFPDQLIVNCDSSDNIYLGGTVYFEGSEGRRYLVLKYDSDGNRIFEKRFEPVTPSGILKSMAVGTDLIYIAGDDDSDSWLKRLDLSGNVVWTENFGTDEYDQLADVAVDSSDNAYVVGDTFGIFPGTGGTDLTNAFVGKFNSSGTNQWYKQYTVVDYNWERKIGVDSSANIYVSGMLDDSFDITTKNEQALFDSPADMMPSMDIFFMKLDTGGNFLWVKEIGSNGNDRFSDFAVDSDGTSYVVGYTSGQFADGEISEPTGYGAFLLSYDTDGNPDLTIQEEAPQYCYMREIMDPPPEYVAKN